MGARGSVGDGIQPPVACTVACGRLAAGRQQQPQQRRRPVRPGRHHWAARRPGNMRQAGRRPGPGPGTPTCRGLPSRRGSGAPRGGSPGAPAPAPLQAAAPAPAVPGAAPPGLQAGRGGCNRLKSQTRSADPSSGMASQQPARALLCQPSAAAPAPAPAPAPVLHLAGSLPGPGAAAAAAPAGGSSPLHPLGKHERPA
jgi:hypothetical protein